MASLLAFPRAASLKYLYACSALFTFSCSQMSMFTYSSIFSKLILGSAQRLGTPPLSSRASSGLSTPECLVTSSSYNLALNAPKKSTRSWHSWDHNQKQPTIYLAQALFLLLKHCFSRGEIA
ncbi:hypothetical protein Nepgr_006095 [Nepenthes gracilis]|uniref:Uncharacterized protein n=1 Tax=Nepenthes gracilis TaxID=150966 RepID=A0AAD3S4K7_NEPGR|nr:hypothetical protein Nepgr_006095 [Nepenthes gracilis]